MNDLNTIILSTESFNMLNLFFEYFWIPICIPIIVGIWNFIINDKLLYVREIKKVMDNDIDSFKELYYKRIDEKYRICAEEILSFLGKNKDNAVQHHLYICKKWNKTVGFIKFMVSKPKKYIFVAYAAIDKDDKTAKRYGMNILASVALKKYFKRDKIDRIIIETQKGANGKMCSAFTKVISRYAIGNKKNAYICNFNYIQPNMPDDDYNITPEEHMTLVTIPYYKPSHMSISKGDLIDLIRTVYFDIYAPSCNGVTNCCEVDYGQYLNSLLKVYDWELLDDIELLSMERE